MLHGGAVAQGGRFHGPVAVYHVGHVVDPVGDALRHAVAHPLADGVDGSAVRVPGGWPGLAEAVLDGVAVGDEAVADGPVKRLVF